MKFILWCFVFLILLRVIGGIKLKTIFVEIQRENDTILINTDHITTISHADHDNDDSWWISLSDGDEVIEISNEQKNKLLNLIKVEKL